MKHLLFLFTIFELAVVIGLTIWVSPGGADLRAEPGGGSNLSSHPVIKEGTPIQVRVVGRFLKGSKPGDQLQAVVVEPVEAGTESVVPLDTRAILQIVSIEKQHHREAPSRCSSRRWCPRTAMFLFTAMPSRRICNEHRILIL